MVRKISLWALAVLLAGVPLAAQGYFEIEQAAVRRPIEPLVGTLGAEEFYAYDGTQFLSTCPLAEPDATVLFLYQDPTGQLYLFIIHGSSTAPVAGVNSQAQFTIQGVPVGADFVVHDDDPNMDPADVYDLVGGQLTWVWAPARTDGGVLGPLSLDFEISLTPGILVGIQRIVFKYGDITNPQVVELATTGTITIRGMRNQPPTVSVSASPTEPRARQEVTFDASASYDPDGQIVEFQWDFDGDGAIDWAGPEAVVTYTYPTGGNFVVRVTAIDDVGVASSFSYPIYVRPVTVRAYRSISTTTALPGYTFRVTVRITTDQDLVGAGLEEDLPVGWEITPVENGGAVFKRPTTQWVFLDTIRAGSQRVITYDVTVPRSELLTSIRLPQPFCIRGIFQAQVPDVVVEVEGESCLMVNDCLSVLEAVAHLIPASMPGEEDRIDLRLSEVITEDQLLRAGELWQSDRPVVDTCGERIDLATMKRITAHAEACVPVDQDLPELPLPNVYAERTIMAPIPCEGVVIGFYDIHGEPWGNKFTVKVEIWADQDVIGVGLDEDLPVGWRVTPLENDGFLYKAAGNQWVLPDTLRAGEVRTIIYEVEVPPTTTVEAPPPEQCEVISAEMIVGRVDTGHPCVEIDVTGQSRVELTDCLSVIVAISRWDVARDTIDLSLSDYITFEQVQRAIAFWLQDERVPRTCGDGRVTYDLMKEIIARWLTDTPICVPLPGAAVEECER
jgi:PKD repeat protein